MNDFIDWQSMLKITIAFGLSATFIYQFNRKSEEGVLVSLENLRFFLKTTSVFYAILCLGISDELE